MNAAGNENKARDIVLKKRRSCTPKSKSESDTLHYNAPETRDVPFVQSGKQRGEGDAAPTE